MIDTAENKQLLIEALRSGKYKQCYGYLRTDDGFCCLGVACDVFIKKTKKGRWKDKHKAIDNYKFSQNSIDTATIYLIPDVKNWYGFEDGRGKFSMKQKNEINKFIKNTYPVNFKGYNFYSSLTHMNDNKVSFHVIADVIEKFL